MGEFKSVSTKLSREEYTHISEYCRKKGVTVSSLIRDLLHSEIKLSRPANVAGNNKIEYSKSEDRFSWFVELDDKRKVEIMRVSPSFLEDLQKTVYLALESRSLMINKRRNASITIPGSLIRGRK